METTKQLALEVNGLMNEYLVLHNDYIKKTNSIFKVFKPIDFHGNSKIARDISSRLKIKMYEIGKKKGLLKNENENFLIVLEQYALALINVLAKFEKINSDLEKKANGEDLSYKNHKRNMEDYEQAIKDYSKAGQQLNNLYNLL